MKAVNVTVPLITPVGNIRVTAPRLTLAGDTHATAPRLTPAGNIRTVTYLVEERIDQNLNRS